MTDRRQYPKRIQNRQQTKTQTLLRNLCAGRLMGVFFAMLTCYLAFLEIRVLRWSPRCLPRLGPLPWVPLWIPAASDDPADALSCRMPSALHFDLLRDVSIDALANQVRCWNAKLLRSLREHSVKGERQGNFPRRQLPGDSSIRVESRQWHWT